MQERSKDNNLSVCIITQNSAHCIERAIRSIENCCDEIVVVDGGSGDDTAEIARSFSKVTYFLRHWTGNYVEQKNWAFDKAKGNWIFSLDSDEVVGRNMRRKIKKMMLSKKHSSYMFPRYWLISDSPCLYVHARKLYPDYQQRLFRNVPQYRYTQNRLVHHQFPEGVQGNAKKVKDTHLFHFDFMYHSRAERVQKVKQRAPVEPETAHINRNQYLYEDHPHRIKKCREKMCEST
jgi:glycosyltransferase involved in cell wall biosynthesis